MGNLGMKIVACLECFSVPLPPLAQTQRHPAQPKPTQTTVTKIIITVFHVMQLITPRTLGLTHTHANTHTRTQTHTHTHTYKHIHAHTHIHAHVHNGMRLNE